MKPSQIRINLILCSVMHGLNHYLMIFYKPMYPLMAGYFGLGSVAEITTRMTIAYVGYGIANFLTGALSRRISLKLLLFFGMLLMSLSTVLMAAVPAGSYSLAIVFSFLMGLGGGTYHPAANTLMTSLYEKKQGHAIGILSIGSAIGFVAAPLLGTNIGRDLIGFQNLFLLSGLAGLLYAVVFFILLRDVPLPKPEPRQGGRALASSSLGPLVFMIVFLCIPTVIRDIVSWGYYEVTPYWVEHGFSQGIGTDVIQLMAYLPGLVVQPLTGKLCDRLGAFRMVLATFFIAAAGHALLAVSSPLGIWSGLVLYGIGMSASTVANETYMASIVSVKQRGLIYGIVLSLALGVGGYLGGGSGWIIDLFGKTAATGYQVWFAGMGAVLFASIFCYYIIERLRKKIKNSRTVSAPQFPET
jgi:MFS family permease